MHYKLLAFLLLLFVGNAALAKDAVVGMSERVFNIINEAQVFIDAEDYPAARELLTGMMERRISSYETAHAYNLIGYTWYEQQDYTQARASYRQALAQEDLPLSMTSNLTLTLGQLCLVEEDYKAAQTYLEQLLTMEDQNTGNNRVLLATALIGQEDYAAALPHLQDAIAERRAEGGEPRENWLSLLASTYYALDDYPAMRGVVRDLVRLYPREQYLMNLAALHGQLGDVDKQLALVQSMMDERRLSQESHLKMLANLLMAKDLPYKAANLLEQEMKAGRIETTQRNLEMLSQAWYSAAEAQKAIPPLEQAAAMADDGKLHLRVARLHMDAYNWEEAQAAGRLALDKGGLRQSGHAWLLRGMAHVRLNQLVESRDMFHQAAKFDETSNYAQQWLAYVDSETERIAALTPEP